MGGIYSFSYSLMYPFIIGIVCYSSHLMIPSNITSKWCLSNCEQHKEAVTSSLLVYGARQGNLVRCQIQLCYICR